MQIRDKIITAACLTPDGIEWTKLKVKQDGNETIAQDSLACATAEPVEGGSALTGLQLSDEVREQLEGDLTVSIRTSELIMRTMEFPTTEPEEIASMVDFQIDKVSPFPLDQLAVSHEILQTAETGSRVLMVAVKHECIDDIGDTFALKGVHIHSIDARILGWLELLNKNEQLSADACEILIVDDGIDFTLVALCNGIPLAFRALPSPAEQKDPAKELSVEVGYTLTTLDAEQDLPDFTAIRIWSLSEWPEETLATLGSETGLTATRHSLLDLPPLSEGIIERTLHRNSRIELIPREWIDLQKLKRLKRRFLISSSVIGAVWLMLMLIFTVVYQTRAIALKRVQKKEASLAPSANEAMQNRQKLRALKSYADRSDSALECLREVTRLLPPGDIEFVSYNYNKDKGVTLRGTADGDSTVYELFDALGDSEQFVELTGQRINTQMTKGVQRAIFSVNLTLSSEENDQ